MTAPPDALPLCWFDGAFLPTSAALLPALSPGVQLGVGVFETVRMSPTAEHAQRHVERWRDAGQQLGLLAPAPLNQIPAIAHELLRRNGVQDAVCRWTWIAGTRANQTPDHMVLHLRPLPIDLERRQIATKARTVQLSRPLAHLKSTSWLAMWKLRKDNADDADESAAILLDPDDNVLEADTANVFVQRDGRVCTPAADGRILAGVMRAVVLDALRRRGVPVQEAPIALTDLFDCDHAYLTNSVVRVARLSEVDGRPIGRPGVEDWIGLCSMRELAGQDVAGQDVAGQDVAGQDVAGQDGAFQGGAGRE